MYGLYYIEIGSSYAHCLDRFYHKWVLSFLKIFLFMHWDNHKVFILQFICVVYHTHRFADIEGSLYSWGKSHLTMMYDPFNMLLDLILLVFYWGFLQLYLSVILAYNFLFCNISTLFWYWSDGGLMEWVWECSFLWNFFWNSFIRVRVTQW